LTHLCILNGTAVLPDRLLSDAVVVCRDERISYVGTSRSRVPASATILDAKGGMICPGFIDIHVHGGGGADGMDGTRRAVTTVCQSHARHGTTTLFLTTSTGTDSQIHAMLAACGEVRDDWTIDTGSQIGGVHLYGPYFAKEKVGCHNASVCRDPKATEFRRYFESGLVRVATCAAELPGASGFYRYAKQRGCLVTCGHSNASWKEMDAGFASGMRHVDHFWCAMSNVSSVRNRLGVPMQGSMLEYVLSNPEMSTEVIADGMHLSPELLHFAWRMKGCERLCLVTDCNRALDMPPGRYRFGPESDGSWFESDGRVGWASPGSLASAVMGMDHMIRTMHKLGGVPLHEVVRMASLTPAERVGIDEEVGSLTRGKRADIVLLSKRLQVKQVCIKGQRCVPPVR
jgi:N-acetylglucosamine-6-phosphate deacetylase